MTEQTPLERLEEAISNWDACHPNDFEFFSQRLFDAAEAYRGHAEARIKELEDALRQSKYKANVFEESGIRDAKLKNEFADKVRFYQAVVKEMQSRINVLEELMQWNPIDSAPKDGRIILLKENDHHETVVISDRVVLDELVKDESLEFTLGPGIRTITLHQLNNIKNMLFRLADEVIRLRDTPSNNDKFYMDGHSFGLAQNENRVKQLEVKLKAWEDAPIVEVSGQALVDYTGDYALDGTYHLKPKEADDAQGN